MNRTVKIVAVLLMGLISGCGNNDNSVRTDNDISGALVSSSGVLSSFVDVDSSFFDDHIPQVAFDGTNYLVVYEETVTSTDHDIIGALVDPNPSAVVPVVDHVNINVSTNDDFAPTVAFDGTNYLIVYQETVTSANHDIIGTLVSPAGVPETPFAIDNSINDDFAPAVAFDGTNYLVGYVETVTSSDHDIIGNFVSKAGVSGTPFVIDGSSNDDIAPAVAFDGTNYLVVYQETVTSTNHDIIGAQVSQVGTVLVGSPFAINTTSSDDVAPSIAFNGANYLVAYQETLTSADHDIIGNRVTPSGVTGTAIAIDTTGFDTVAPAVASDGTNYFVVYEDVF